MPRIDASSSPDATTNGWRAGPSVADAFQEPDRSQPAAVRIHGIGMAELGNSDDAVSHRQDANPTPPISNKIPAINRMESGREIVAIRVKRWAGPRAAGSRAVRTHVRARPAGRSRTRDEGGNQGVSRRGI